MSKKNTITRLQLRDRLEVLIQTDLLPCKPINEEVKKYIDRFGNNPYIKSYVDRYEDRIRSITWT